MCAAFWSDILVIISLDRYSYMLCVIQRRGPGASEGARDVTRQMLTPTLPQPDSPLYDTQHI